jgi:CxxC motif-containing protein
VLERIYALSVDLPVRQGDLLAELDGVQIVATRSLDE